MLILNKKIEAQLRQAFERGQQNGFDRRTLPNTHIRAVRQESGERTLEWNPIIKNVESSHLYFREMFTDDAFNDTDFSDVRALWNHNTDIVMGRRNTNVKTLEWSWVGDKFEAKVLLGKHFSEERFESCERGDVSAGSFRFYTDWKNYEWKEEGDIYVGICNKVDRVDEVSIVAFPAYDATDNTVYAGKRSFEKIEQDLIKNRQQELTPEEKFISLFANQKN